MNPARLAPLAAPWLKRHWPGLLLAALVIIVYGIARHREAFGCDSWAYIAQARLLRGKDVGLTGGLDPHQFPALVPLCAELAGRNIVPGMPPGYSLLLALGGLFRLESMVSPLVGGATAFLIYFATQANVGRTVALVAAALWSVSPIATWSGTEIMGDLSAACALLLSRVLLTRGRTRAGGVVLGFSIGIRPTNALFGPAGLLSAKGWPERLRFGVGAALGLGFWLVFGLGRYGGAGMFGMYGHNASFVTYGAWAHQLSFIAKTTAMMFPLLLPLAVLAAWRNPRAHLPLLVWAGAIVLFYVGWRWKYDAWWWVRHVLPAYPAVVILGAHGFAECWRWAENRRAIKVACVLAVGANLAWSASFVSRNGLLDTASRDLWIRDVYELKASLPPRALVGGLNFSGPLRLYGGIESCRWDSDRAAELIDYANAQHRPVYLLIEPPLYDTHPASLALRARYTIADVKQMRALGTVLRKVVSGPEASGHGS